MSALGQKWTCAAHTLMSALGQKRTSGRLWPLGKQSCDARQDHSEFGELAGLRLNLD
jgi:hypothetical protein